MNNEKKYDIVLPDPGRPGEWHCVSGVAMPKKEALAYVPKNYGADEEGRVCLLNEMPEDTSKEEGDDNDQ